MRSLWIGCCSLLVTCLLLAADGDLAAVKKKKKSKAKPKVEAPAKKAPEPPPEPTSPPEAKVEPTAAPVADAPPIEAPATKEVNIRLVELFSVEQLPGSGVLAYHVGDKVENIVFGNESGVYGLGMIFKGENLPDQYGREFSGNNILQLALGTMRSRLVGQLPQFGALTVLAGKVPFRRTSYPLIVSTGRENKDLSDIGFLLFTSPSTPNERSDEEKLKGTYFANKGTVSLTPVGDWKVMEVRASGKRMNFKLRMMKVDFEATLVTPFATQAATLNGSIEIPVYAAASKDAEKLTNKIASDSLESTASLAVQESLGGQTPRDISSPQTKPKKKK